MLLLFYRDKNKTALIFGPNIDVWMPDMIYSTVTF